MGETETPGERIVRLETQIGSMKEQIAAMKEQMATKSAREWGLISAIGALIATILATKLGFLS